MYWWREEEGERDGLWDGLSSSVLCQNQFLKGGKNSLIETHFMIASWLAHFTDVRIELR